MTVRLAIAIPAYNRPQLLRDNLEAMRPELLATGTPVFISDDSSDDQVGATVAEFAATCPQITYLRNRPGLGHDGNCLRTLSLPDTDYVWYLGDALRVVPGGLSRVLALLEAEQPDFLVVNTSIRAGIAHPSGMRQDPQAVLTDLAWHMTMTGVSIYHRRFLNPGDDRYDRFLGSNFIQLGIILTNLAGSRGLYWLNENWIAAHPGKPDSYWLKTVFKVFAKDWADFILGLGAPYTAAAQRQAVLAHSRHTGLLEWKALKGYRRQGILTAEEVRRYHDYWPLVSAVPRWRIGLLARIPAAVMRFLQHPLGRRRKA